MDSCQPATQVFTMVTCIRVAQLGSDVLNACRLSVHDAHPPGRAVGTIRNSVAICVIVIDLRRVMWTGIHAINNTVAIAIRRG